MMANSSFLNYYVLTVLTRFKITRPSECSDLFKSKDVVRKIHEDEDGDLSPPRKCVSQDDSDVITIGTVSLDILLNNPLYSHCK